MPTNPKTKALTFSVRFCPSLGLFEQRCPTKAMQPSQETEKTTPKTFVLCTASQPRLEYWPIGLVFTAKPILLDNSILTIGPTDIQPCYSPHKKLESSVHDFTSACSPPVHRARARAPVAPPQLGDRRRPTPRARGLASSVPSPGIPRSLRRRPRAPSLPFLLCQTEHPNPNLIYLGRLFGYLYSDLI